MASKSLIDEMILTIVFSRDRALQLQATLASFRLQVSDAVAAQVVVLYRATSRRHQSQYHQLARDVAPHVSLVEESDFRNQVIDILKRKALNRAGSAPELQQRRPGDICLFLVDDSIFVRPLRLGDAQQALGSNTDTLGFSLRLGRNTTYCYSLRRPQALPKFNELEHGVLKFRWRGAEGDFSYPLEISSSMYRLQTVSNLISDLQFSSPSDLESQMALRARGFSGRQPSLLCYENSVAFCVPLNRVQEVYQNRSGSASRFSTDHLADLFDQGKRVNVRALSGFAPHACHQEIELDFERSDDHDQPAS